MITVHAYDWTVEDSYTEDDHLAVHAWCLDRDSRPHLLRFNNFPAFCQLELPLFVHNRPYKWDQTKATLLVDTLTSHLGEEAPCHYHFHLAKKTYYYRGERRYPMITLSFNTIKAMQRCVNLLKNPIRTDDWGVIKCNVWENEISVVRKLLTARDVRFSQWFTVDGIKAGDERISTVEEEYIVDWTTMNPVPPEVSAGWQTFPTVLAWDIECYSDNHRAMPDRYASKHVAYMISCIYQRLGYPETRRRYGIIFGQCHPVDLPDTTIIQTDSEYAMVEAFAQVVQETDPEILTGFNILSFDNPYLDTRIKRLLLDWPVMGRIPGKRPIMSSTTWKSGAYGHNSINILRMDGRITLDLLPLIRRDYKLDKYTLEAVCQHFLSKGKHDVPAPEMFRIYERTFTATTEKEKTQSLVDMTRVMAYCIQDSELVVDLMIKVNAWISLVELSNIVGLPIIDLYVRGQQSRCMSQLYNAAAPAGFVIDHRDVPGFRFEGGFVYETKPGLYENILCFDFASLYPSIIMAYNICYTTFVPPELENEIPEEDTHIIEFDQEEGEAEEEEEDDVLKEVVKKKAPKKVKKIVHHRFRFMKQPEGLLPKLVRSLVTERRAVNAKKELEKDPITALVLDKRQWALKISANSFFGFLGVHEGGVMPFIEGAMSITARGRELITGVQRYLEEKYNAVTICGDTDSVMIDLHITDPRECQRWGIKISQEISGAKAGEKDEDGNEILEDRAGLFPPPLAILYEKGMRILAIVKKRYASLLIEKDGSFKRGKTGELEILKRGIVLARRDNCLFLRKTYTDILTAILTRKSLPEAMDILVNAVKDLMEGRVPWQQLTIIRALGSSYKSPSFFMKVFSDELRKAGKIVSPGDRIDFLIVEDPQARLLGLKMKLPEQYLESLQTDAPLRPDFVYYLSKALMNPINQLFEVGYKETIARLPGIGFRPSSRHKFIGLDKPVKLLLKMLEKQKDISILGDVIRANLKPKTRLNIVE